MSKEQAKKIAELLHGLDQKAVQALAVGRYEDALTVYREVLKAEQELKLEKESGHTMMNIANTLLALGRNEEAMAYLDAAAGNPEIRRSGKDTTMVQLYRASALFRMNRLGEAERLLTDTLRTCRDNALIGKLELMRCDCYWQSGQSAKVRSSLDRAVRCLELANDQETIKRALMYRIRFFERAGQAVYAAGDRDRLQKLLEEARNQKPAK